MAEKRVFDCAIQAIITATFKAESESAARKRFAEFLSQLNTDDYIQTADGEQFYVSIDEDEKPDVTEVCTAHQSQMRLGYCPQCRKEERKPKAGSAAKRGRS